MRILAPMSPVILISILPVLTATLVAARASLLLLSIVSTKSIENWMFYTFKDSTPLELMNKAEI